MRYLGREGEASSNLNGHLATLHYDVSRRRSVEPLTDAPLQDGKEVFDKGHMNDEGLESKPLQGAVQLGFLGALEGLRKELTNVLEQCNELGQFHEALHRSEGLSFPFCGLVDIGEIFSANIESEDAELEEHAATKGALEATEELAVRSRKAVRHEIALHLVLVLDFLPSK